MTKLPIIFSFLFLSIGTAKAQYYDTLPKGVRLITNKYIQSEISSSFNRSQSETPFSYQVEANADTLEGIDNETVQGALDLIKPYAEAYNNISLGTYRIDADAELDVNVYGFGYGVTDRMTAYVGVPIFKANVNVRYQRVKSNNHQEVSNILQKNYGDNWAQLLGGITQEVYDLDAAIIQSGVVNTLGYQEIGDWRGSGLGDIEFGIMHNFLREDKYGLMLTVGGAAPTGYVDDPDIIQDIGFGDGQWDAFVELGGGYQLSNSVWVNAWSRYTHQFESEKELRIPFNEDIDLGMDKAKFREKLGNKLLVGLDTEIYVNDWFKLQPSVSYTKTDKAKYYSGNTEANRLLAENSDSESRSYKILGQFSSVELFKKDKFLLPAQIKISYQEMAEGKNTPKVNITEFEFRMFF